MRPPSPSLLLSFVRLTLGALFCIGAVSPAIAQVVVGPNVNMGGGPATFTPPSTIVGDPFLQRQNEPSIAVSSRNPCHLLAGANDYRAVDVEEAAGEVGDAWLGVFKSFDCGATWTSTLLPGHKLDTSNARPHLADQGARGRCRPHGACRHQRPLLLQRHCLQSRRGRSRQGVRRPVHRQQQQGRRRSHPIPRHRSRSISAPRASFSTSPGSSPTCRAAAADLQHQRPQPCRPVPSTSSTRRLSAATTTCTRTDSSCLLEDLSHARTIAARPGRTRRS